MSLATHGVKKGQTIKGGILRRTWTQNLDHAIIGKFSYIDQHFLFAVEKCILIHNFAKFWIARSIGDKNMGDIRYKTT